MSDNQLEKNLRLLEVRKALGMTQLEMADLLGMDRGNLASVENMKSGRNVRPDAVYILANKKGVNPKWFETGEGDMFREKTPLVYQDGFGEPERDEIRKPTIEDKLAFVLERNQEISDKVTAALEKNVQLLEIISGLKDQLMEKEREIFHIKSSKENNPHAPAGAQ